MMVRGGWCSFVLMQPWERNFKREQPKPRCLSPDPFSETPLHGNENQRSKPANYGAQIMRIRFRASDFGLVAKINLTKMLVQNRNRLLVRRWCSGHSLFFSCDQGVRFLDSENSSQRRLLLRPAPRRVHFARPWIQASKPTLRI